MITTRTRLGRPEYYDDATQETVLGIAPVAFADDFLIADNSGWVPPAEIIDALGAEYSLDSLMSSESDTLTTGSPWAKYCYNGGVVRIADPIIDDAGAKGVCELSVSTDDFAQNAALFLADTLPFNLTRQLVFEARVAFDTVPTSDDTEITSAVVGLCSVMRRDPDLIEYSAWFRWDGSGACYVETDDATTDSGAVSTGVTMTAGRYYQLRIEGSGNTLWFYVDGVLVATHAVAFSTDLVQPVAIAWKTKASENDSEAELHIDKIAVWQDR